MPVGVFRALLGYASAFHELCNIAGSDFFYRNGVVASENAFAHLLATVWAEIRGLKNKIEFGNSRNPVFGASGGLYCVAPTVQSTQSQRGRWGASAGSHGGRGAFEARQTALLHRTIAICN